MRMIRILFILFLLLAGSVAAQQPNPEAIKKARERQAFRQAQRYQRSNEHEKAVILLQRLYAVNPGSVKYYQELLESLLQLDLLEPARNLIDQQKKSDPFNPRYDIDLASVLYKSGDHDRARAVWKEVLRQHGENVTYYIMVANAMARQRLTDEVVQVYREAYRKHPDKVFLLKTLGDYYRQQLRYRQALSYYLAYIRKEPRNYPSVIRQALSFNLPEPQADSIATMLKDEAKKYPGVAGIQILAAKFLQKYQRYPEALQIYRDLENRKSRGKYLMEFAQAVSADSLYDLALQAYTEIIKRFPRSPQLLTAYLGAANCHLQLARREDSQEHARQAIEMINNVKRRYPDHPQTARLSLLEGDIYRQFFFDLDRAVKIYLEVAQQFAGKPDFQSQALLRAGESQIVRGDLAAAEAILETVAHKKYLPSAHYWQAKAAFYRGDFETCQTYLNEVIQASGIAGEYVNDVLDLQGLLLFQKSARQALQLYAQADHLILQGQKSQAIAKLRNGLKNNPPAALRSRMLFLASDLSVEIGEYAEALDYCNQILGDGSLALYADQAVFMMAEIFYRRLNNLAQAYQLYDRILVEFPESQYGSAARDRLKELRQKYPELIP